VTPDGIRLEGVEQLARACPDEFRRRRHLQQYHCLGHDRDRVPARIGDAPGEDGDAGRAPPDTGSATARTCGRVVSAVTFTFTPEALSRRTGSYAGSRRVFVTGILT